MLGHSHFVGGRGRCSGSDVARGAWHSLCFGCHCGPTSHGKGWLLGHTFLLLTHVGRRTGRPHETVAMVLRYRRQSHEAVICSAWGPDTDWVRNIRERPAVRIDLARETFEPEQRFLSVEESLCVVDDCLHQHPWRFRLMAWVLGWGDLRVEAVARDFVQTRPFVAFRPAAAPPERT